MEFLKIRYPSHPKERYRVFIEGETGDNVIVALDEIPTDSNVVSLTLDETCQRLNEQDQQIKELTKENKKLKSDLARIIEQAKKNDEFCRSDIRILEKALWCPNCANDIKRLKELRKEFKE